MQVGVNVSCMYTNFGGCSFSNFGDIATFKIGQFFLSDLIDQNRLKKFMQVGIDVTCMHTSFGGHGFFGFGDMATFQKRAKFPFQTICSIAQSTSGYEEGSKLVPNYSRGFGPPQFSKLHGVQSHAWAGLLEVSVAQCACAEVS